MDNLPKYDAETGREYYYYAVERTKVNIKQYDYADVKYYIKMCIRDSIICFEQDYAIPSRPVNTAKEKERSLNRMSMSGKISSRLQLSMPFCAEIIFREGP